MIEEKIAKIVESFGAKLYDTEIAREDGREYFRVYVTKKEGVTLDLCQNISKMISPLLDVEYHSSEPYFLEVSSPGIERKLRKPEHFKLSIGEMLKVKTKEKETIEGTLTSLSDTHITLDEKIDIEFEDIKSASTIFKW